MNIPKNILTLFFILFISIHPSLISINQQEMPPMPSPGEIKEIMETPEFQEMMRELEKIFEKDETNRETTKKQETLPQKKESNIKRTPISPPKSIKQNFIEEIKTNNKAKTEKLITKIPTEKTEAFYHFTNLFTRKLNHIEKKINSFELGIHFKEHLENLGFNKILNEIDVALNQIKSKKLYQKVFFLPSNTSLRRNIIDALDILKKIESEINKIGVSAKKQKQKTIDFVQKIINPTQKRIKTRKLTPLQEKIVNFFNNNLKGIATKINLITVNPKAKEEIERKKKLRNQLNKKVLTNQKSPHPYNYKKTSYPHEYRPDSTWKKTYP